MIWRICHWFFGWDYVVVANSTLRVRTDGEGVPYIKGFYGTHLLITNVGSVLWLTCCPNKYLGGLDRHLPCEFNPSTGKCQVHFNKITLSDVNK